MSVFHKFGDLRIMTLLVEVIPVCQSGSCADRQTAIGSYPVHSPLFQLKFSLSFKLVCPCLLQCLNSTAGRLQPEFNASEFGIRTF